ncbi:Wzz/FepE/Etk N-terminal domain-containing protein [Pseudoalteromonas sp. ASV78]|uniref:Wzz/FepE/Etk N-terminal domain-containing protein n=1 Tax=Pseudoalteromonas sp. ASV78 TaxID=3397851 RepID=UPI0039FD6987
MSDKIESPLNLNRKFKSSFINGDVDLRLLVGVVWQSKLAVFISIITFTISATLYAINQPNIYQSEVLLAPADSEQSGGGLAALAGQFGGLASIAGINLGGAGSVSKIQLAVEVVKSRRFIFDFIERHNILLELMAADGWDMGTNVLSYDEDIYDVNTNQWVRNVSAPLKKIPSLQEAYKEFRNIFYIYIDEETGMIRISIEHVSPYIAQQWVNWLVKDINNEMKELDVSEAKKSTEFLKKQLELTNVADIKSVLYSLIEEQAKTIMFANVRDEYVFKTIDPALIPEEKIKPKRAIMCILGGVFGLIVGVLFVLFKSLRVKNS